MAGYEQTGEIVFDAVKRGVEYMYYGTVHFWIKETPEASDKWFKLMKNKKYKAKVLVYGWGDHEREYIHRVKSMGNPNVQLRVIKEPLYPVDTEQAITDDTVILFTGGNTFSSVVIRSQKMAATFKTTFLQLWSLAEEPTM